MKLSLRFFAGLRERLQCAQEDIEITDDVSVADLRSHLAARGGVWAEALNADARIMVAVNEEMATAHTPLSAGDVVAFFPPVTGG